MKHIIVIKYVSFSLIILFSLNSYTQTKESDFLKDWEIIDLKKETIYLLFKNKKNCTWQKKFYMKKEKGIIFNLGCKHYGSCLFPNTSKSDTLCYKHINDYKISTMEDVKKKVKDFRFKTYKKRPKNNDDKLYQAYDNNDIFKTYIIEIISKEKFVLYPVIWRNQKVM